MGRTFKDRPVFGYFYDQGQALYFINELPSMPHVGRDTFRRVGSWESGSFKTVVLDSCGDEVWRQKADGVGAYLSHCMEHALLLQRRPSTLPGTVLNRP